MEGLNGNLEKYLDTRFRNLESDVKEIKQGEIGCRGEIFPRLSKLEIAVATMGAGSWRGAFIIGGCSLAGTSLAIIFSKLL